MAKKNSNNKWLVIIIIILVIGLGAALVAVFENSDLRQHASQFSDINSGEDIDQTNNPDGTMGPADYTGNFSNTLPPEYLGYLNFQVTDPKQEHKPTDVPPPHPTQAINQENNGNNLSTTPTPSGIDNSGGPQTVTSLLLTVKKVEVHLAHIGIPGEKNDGKPSGTPTPKNNQGVDKWEVLNIGGTKTIDLVQLAKKKDFSSLGLTKLANGRYTQIRLYIGTAIAILQDGTQVTLIIPDKANIVKIVEPFVVDAGKTTTLTMDFDAQNSVIKAGDKYILKPVVARLDQQNQD